MTTPALAAPQLSFFANLSVQVSAPQEIGKTMAGNRRVIPILGGDVKGEGWTARVLPGGADFQLILAERVAHLDARYVLETDAGDLIFVQNRALRAAAPDVTAKLIRGEPVDPALVYFRCVPAFETASRALGWINERMFIGTGVRRPDRVEISVFTVA
jgi:hypothetical protein